MLTLRRDFGKPKMRGSVIGRYGLPDEQHCRLAFDTFNGSGSVSVVLSKATAAYIGSATVPLRIDGQRSEKEKGLVVS